MEQELSLLIVFAAGLLSFLSPCVLPLIPGYIAFVSGLSIDHMTESGWTDKIMASAMLNSVMFVLGFSFVFVVLGASATWLGGFLVQRLPLLISIAGVVIIIFGLRDVVDKGCGTLLTSVTSSKAPCHLSFSLKYPMWILPQATGLC